MILILLWAGNLDSSIFWTPGFVKQTANYVICVYWHKWTKYLCHLMTKHSNRPSNRDRPRVKVHDWFYTRQDSEFIWSAYCVKIPGLIVVSKWSWFFYSWFCAKLHSTSLQTKYIYNCNWPIELLKQFLPLFCCILCCGVQLQSHPKKSDRNQFFLTLWWWWDDTDISLSV